MNGIGNISGSSGRAWRRGSNRGFLAGGGRAVQRETLKASGQSLGWFRTPGCRGCPAVSAIASRKRDGPGSRKPVRTERITMHHITRRSALTGIASAVATGGAGEAFASSGPPTPPEHPATRCARLAAELADALNDYADGRFHAQVYPSLHHDYPVAFTSTAARHLAETEAFALARLGGAYRRAFWKAQASRQAGGKPDWKAVHDSLETLIVVARGKPPVATW